MAITDYASLQAAIAARAIRTDLTTLIPDFVRAAHDQIVNALAVVAKLTLSDTPSTVPADFREAVVFIVERYPSRPLTLVGPEQITSQTSGVPCSYWLDGTTVGLYPTPNASFAARLLYKLSRAPFSDAADTNTALDRYPSLYLWGAMAELYAHTRNADERDRYLNLFLAALDSAREAERADLYSNLVLQPSPSMVV